MRYSSSPSYTNEPRPAAPYSSRHSTHSPYHSGYRSGVSRSRWPPSPSVEDEKASLAREFPSSAFVEDDGGSSEAKSRGSVDQYPIIQEVEQPHNDERRFVLVSDPAEDGTYAGATRGRRKSFAERGNMAPLNTNLSDPPVFTGRTSTPYAYSKPQKESLAPSTGEYFLSPEPITPSSSSVPISIPNRNARDGGRDQSAGPARQIPVRSRHEPAVETQPSSKPKNYVFDDSDEDTDTSHLHTGRRPARYSFVKSDLQKEDLRSRTLDSQPRPAPKKHDSFPPSSTSRRTHDGPGTSSSGSSKHPTPPSDSPRSSSSSLYNDGRKPKSAQVHEDYGSSSKYPNSRPSSPRYRESSPPRSPRLQPHRPPSPITSRPSSRSGTRPSSPLSFSNKQVHHSPRVPVSEADWHATYPPTVDRSRPISRHGRHETMPAPKPRIDVQSPSPARPPRPENPLPYPVDDRVVDAFMPPEEQYQYDHGLPALPPSPRQTHLNSPIPGSPREQPSGFRPQLSSRQNTNTDDIPRSPRARSSSIRSSSKDGRRDRHVPGHDRPLPSCPRTKSGIYTDWYILQNCPDFDICPSCYENVFADTPFSVYFSQSRQYERPRERNCDFRDPWVRLAWLLTIKQRRSSPDLLYKVATITEQEDPCPGNRELTTDQQTWYGIQDHRDGIHVANFAVCPRDLKMMEALFPSIRLYFTRIPPSGHYTIPVKYLCSLRLDSHRFVKYLDLLVQLDAEAEMLGQRPNIHRFVQMARENAFKAECQRDKQLFGKPWHFIPSLPEFTVCQECFEELIWPAIASSSNSTSSFSAPLPPSTIPNLFNRTIQPVPDEDPEVGSSCCLYSPRMRDIWEHSVHEEDFGLLRRSVMERKTKEILLSRDRRDIEAWLKKSQRGSVQWDRLLKGLEDNEREWRKYE